MAWSNLLPKVHRIHSPVQQCTTQPTRRASSLDRSSDSGVPYVRSDQVICTLKQAAHMSLSPNIVRSSLASMTIYKWSDITMVRNWWSEFNRVRNQDKSSIDSNEPTTSNNQSHNVNMRTLAPFETGRYLYDVTNSVGSFIYNQSCV